VGEFVPFNSDEAIVALMARHILQGERPVFFYGQAYMGSLDAFLVAGLFALFGEQVWGIRLVQGLLYLGVLATTAWLGKNAFGSWKTGTLAALLLAIPSVNVTLYTTASLGGYGEALLIGNLSLLCGLSVSRSLSERDSPGPFGIWLLLGFLSGLGLWAFSLVLVYTLPLVIYLLVNLWRWLSGSTGWQRTGTIGMEGHARLRSVALALGILTLGFFLGAAPWWGFALRHGCQQLWFELRGGAISGVEGLSWLPQVGQHLFSLVILGGTVIFGLRPPWEVSWLALPLLPFVLIFWIGVLIYIVRFIRRPGPQRSAAWLLVGVMVAVALGFVFSPFGADPSGRYFLPLAAPLALFAASMILDLRERFGRWAYSLVLLLLLFHLWGTLQSAWRFPPGITTQFYAPAQVDHRAMDELIAFLNQHGEAQGYTNYWVSYPLAFLSEETLIYVPRLPYHPDFRYTARDDRYARYAEIVAQAGRVAYITTHNPDLEAYLRERFSGLGISWQEAQIGDYRVFYALSRVVRPDEIGLGASTP
jgi:4-amino-4-deoxy-L-arabinose transferase-like glycosyltransferase